MKPNPTKRRDIKDGGRQRCVDCGHPRMEHTGGFGCSVPKCPCATYAQLMKVDRDDKS